MADLLSPKTKICGRKFLLTVDDLTFIGHPNLLKVDNSQATASAAAAAAAAAAVAATGAGSSVPQSNSPGPLPLTSSGDFHADSSMIHFNLVFVLQSSDKQIAHELHEHVIFKWSAALKHEQLRDNYVGRESELLMSLQEKFNISGTNDPAVVKQGFMEEALKTSSLAREMKSVFEAVHNGRCVGLRVNDWVEISVLLPRPTPHFTVPLRVYHTILLLDDPKAIMRSLPADSSPLLLALVQCANPYRSFQELQKEVGCSLAQLFRLSAHLMYWNKAKIIDHITQNNIYVVSKTATLDMYAPPSHSHFFFLLFSKDYFVVLLETRTNIRNLTKSFREETWSTCSPISRRRGP